MKLNNEALQTIAECISRCERLEIELGHPTTTNLWYETCQELSAVTMPIKGISTTGVYDLGEMRACINGIEH